MIHLPAISESIWYFVSIYYSRILEFTRYILHIGITFFEVRLVITLERENKGSRVYPQARDSTCCIPNLRSRPCDTINIEPHGPIGLWIIQKIHYTPHSSFSLILLLTTFWRSNADIRRLDYHEYSTVNAKPRKLFADGTRRAREEFLFVRGQPQFDLHYE